MKHTPGPWKINDAKGTSIVGVDGSPNLWLGDGGE